MSMTKVSNNSAENLSVQLTRGTEPSNEDCGSVDAPASNFDAFLEELTPPNDDQPKKVYTQRRDVLYKGILRKCRKYFQNRFLSETGHVKYRKSKPKRYASLKENLRQFCQKNFPDSQEEMDFYLGSFIYPNEMEKILNIDGASQSKLELVDTIH